MPNALSPAKKYVLKHRTLLGVVVGLLAGVLGNHFWRERQTLLMITDSDADQIMNNNAQGVYNTKFGTMIVVAAAT